MMSLGLGVAPLGRSARWALSISMCFVGGSLIRLLNTDCRVVCRSSAPSVSGMPLTRMLLRRPILSRSSTCLCVSLSIILWSAPWSCVLWTANLVSWIFSSAISTLSAKCLRPVWSTWISVRQVDFKSSVNCLKSSFVGMACK